MSLHESFIEKQMRHASRLDAVIAAAVAGTHCVTPLAGATASPPQTVAASSLPPPAPMSRQAPAPSPATKPLDAAVTPEPGTIGFGWDAIVADINVGIAARGGVLPSYVQTSEIAPPQTRAPIKNDPHGWAAVVDRLNSELPRSAAQQRTPDASSWDDVIASMNAESGFAVPANG